MLEFLKKYIGIVLLVSAVVIGLLTYKNYGIAFDEARQRDIGITSYKYIFEDDQSLVKPTSTQLLTVPDHYYGVAYEVPLYIMTEKIMHLKDLRDIYFIRHIITHFFFLFSAFIFFLLIDHIYKNKFLAAIGFLLLVAHPLIYGHSFFNTKDIPFLSMFIICFWLCTLAFNKNSYKYFALLGIGCGILTDIRVMGIVLIGCIGLFFMIDFLFSKRDKKQKRKTIFIFLTFFISAMATIYTAWPYLWLHPIKNSIDVFTSMSKFPWTGSVLFNGNYINAHNLPWSYILIWFLITTPIVYLVVGCLGIGIFIVLIFRSGRSFLDNSITRNNMLYLFCFFTPMLAVVILNSVLYDSWRQLFFIYPSFVLLAIYGLNCLIHTKFKLIASAIVVMSIGFTIVYMIENYPFEHIYFNAFVTTKSNQPEYLRNNWELDYWGTSFKQGLDYIVRNDTSKTINIYAKEWPGISNSYLLKPADKSRLHYVDFNQANYFITNYRGHPGDFPFPPSQVYYSIKVLNSSILTVFKLK